MLAKMTEEEKQAEKERLQKQIEESDARVAADLFGGKSKFSKAAAAEESSSDATENTKQTVFTAAKVLSAI